MIKTTLCTESIFMNSIYWAIFLRKMLRNFPTLPETPAPYAHLIGAATNDSFQEHAKIVEWTSGQRKNACISLICSEKVIFIIVNVEVSHRRTGTLPHPKRRKPLPLRLSKHTRAREPWTSIGSIITRSAHVQPAALDPSVVQNIKKASPVVQLLKSVKEH